MDLNAYIESGILELYVAGQLSEKENEEIYELLQQHPELLKEVLDIEAAVIKLTASVSPHAVDFSSFSGRLTKDTKVVDLKPKKPNWISYTGWAASILLAGGLIWTMNKNKELEADLEVVKMDAIELEYEIEKTRNNLEDANSVLAVMRDNNVTKVPLAGQGNFEDTYANVYWDKDNNRVLIDADGLPEAPEGKVYQVWSLTLNPLTPTSLGTIDDFNTDDNKIFAIANANESEAFGITLEPAGGSETPTMEQLHTLGVVSTAP
ncbi:anti-sigma factor domain-containing protein [Winogradskyella sp. A3E31]|uniref:anti-sigma factor n=1 Tax=Winogradskyella sp. A3E31 TaxID=3349637 RepID=UPI00398B2367